MATNNSPLRPRAAVDRALEESSSGRSVGRCDRGPSRLDTLLLHNVCPSYSYSALHGALKEFGTIHRIRVVYDADDTNRCYVQYSSGTEAQTAFEAAASLPVGGRHFRADLLDSANVSAGDNDYVPNLFEDAATATSPRVRQAPTPRWFVAYYREGRGNFIHASRYLMKEVGWIPDGNLKTYGKGILIRACDLTQAKMLLNLPCSPSSIFEAIKPHRSFNTSKGCLYNRDLYEFSEADILAMCPDSVQKVTKLRGGNNMVLLHFYGSLLPDSIRIGPLPLRVKPFLDRPLQCYGCYNYGHGKKYCTEHPRCGNCSALDSHSTADCESAAYCFHCRDAHPLRSRQCPRYRLEQDILHLANTQFISLGSARRELAFRQRRSGEVQSYASTLIAPSTKQSRGQANESQILVPLASSSRSSKATSPPVSVRNGFSALVEESVVDSAVQEETSVQTVVAEVHASSPPRRRSSKLVPKRRCGSTDSLAFPPSKVSASAVGVLGSNNQSPVIVAATPLDSSLPSSDPAPVATCDMDTTLTSQDVDITGSP